MADTLKDLTRLFHLLSDGDVIHTSKVLEVLDSWGIETQKLPSSYHLVLTSEEGNRILLNLETGDRLPFLTPGVSYRGDFRNLGKAQQIMLPDHRSWFYIYKGRVVYQTDREIIFLPLKQALALVNVFTANMGAKVSRLPKV